ncbi:MAG: malonyl-CoA decarboxylase domain-containing protein, partial [Pseudorhizobium sp.]
DDEDWADDAQKSAAVEPVMTAAAAWYFLKARDAAGRTVDPVARFHLGNGARLERLNVLGDRSQRALRQAHGLMVNYLYKLDEIEANHEAFAGRREVVTTQPIRRLVPADKFNQSLVPVRDPSPLTRKVAINEHANSEPTS